MTGASGPAGTGHRADLAHLGLDGTGSVGRYTPHSFDLQLLGTRQAADHVVYLHEVHHAALNDTTAWGSALHVLARLPAADAVFRRLLDDCRTVHESLATFASVQIATARHGALDDVLAAYPRYLPLYEATVRVTERVNGTNRRQQIATAMARACMQTPVLQNLLDTGLDAFRMADVRRADRPDARWAWLLRRGPDLIADAARAADRCVVQEFGPQALHDDGPDTDLYTATDRSHDDAWDRWELAAYDHLREALAATGACTLSLTGHQDATAELVHRAQQVHGDLGLRAAMTDTQRRDDAELAASVLQQVRHDFSRGERPRARAVPNLDVEDLVNVMSQRTVVHGRPAMIVDARPIERLRALYRWPEGAGPAPTAQIAVRVPAEDNEGPVMGHVPLPEPAHLAALAERWGNRGPFLLCVGASCLADPAFATRWLQGVPPPVIVLVDVEPARFVPRWAGEGRTVVAVPLRVQDTGGQRSALLFTADDGQVWWLVVADDVTVRLMLEYLRGQLGPALRTDPQALAAIREAALVAVTHILATEPFTSFDALGDPHAR